MYAYSRWLLGLSFASVGILIYYLFRKDEEPDENFGISSSRRTTIEVKVPEDMIGTIIGRGGCNIRSIQDKTGARIRCNDKLGSDVFRIVTIQGAPDSAQLAEFMIRDMIINQPPIVTTEIWIPTKACGRIIGKGGESIRAMTSMTNAKILIDTKYGEGEQAKTRVVLKGTEEQVDSAKQMIECKVIEEDDFQRRLVTSANQSMRREPNKNINYLLAPSSDEEVKVMSKPGREKLISAGSDGFVDVFVSASETPGQFWVQVISSKGVQLDWLVDEMTEYYSEPKNQQLHVLNEINLGQIVAAPFENDNKWYRAEILEIKENEYDPQESEVSLYYKDFGDKCVLKQKKIFDLCSKYLFLDFQAIECSLAKIEPVGSQWSSETCHVFDELAGVALWEKRLAYVVTYKDSAQQRGHEESGPLPVIELHDTEKKINIGEELVKRKLARWESNVSGEDKSDTKVTKPIHVSQPEGQVHTSNQKVQNENLGLKHPSKMATSASFGPGSTTSTSKSGGLGSFLENERKGKSSSGFRPKTLGLPSKVQTKPTVVAVPESFSSDEDSDGFVLG